MGGAKEEAIVMKSISTGLWLGDEVLLSIEEGR